MNIHLKLGVLVLWGMLQANTALCQSEAEDLAKTAQNPLGDLVSLPLQNNVQFGVGPDDRLLNVLNIQPVCPIDLNDDWNLITRTILPVISSPLPGTSRTNGIGDLNFTAFFSPSAPGNVIWGVGPVLSFPTASDDVLGTDRYSGGLSAVVADHARQLGGRGAGQPGLGLRGLR